MSGPQPVIEPQRYLRETNQSYAFPSFRKFIHDSDDEEKEKEKEEGGGGGEKVVQTDGLLTRRVRTAEEKVRRSHDDDDNDNDDDDETLPLNSPSCTHVGRGPYSLSHICVVAFMLSSWT